MAKPILIAKLHRKVDNRKELVNALTDIDKALQTNLKKEYHVITIYASKDKDALKFECLNDCKGLNNGRIEQVIKGYKQLWQDLTEQNT